jgi:hypothetical protein
LAEKQSSTSSEKQDSGSSNQKGTSSSSRKRASASNQKGTSSSRNGRKDPVELARAAVQTLVQLTGHQPETVLGLRRGEDGWQVLVEMVEMRRVPNSTDVLGCYAVDLDRSGDVVGYQRRRRYQRGQTGGDEG